MSLPKKLEKVVFLLGAGFSKSAGLPTSVELANSFKEFVINRANQKGPKSLKLLQFYIEGGIRFQFGKRGLDPSAPVNVEQIAIAARHLLAREKNPLAPFISGWHPHLTLLLADEPRLLDDYLACFYEHLRLELGFPEQRKIAYIDRLAQIAAKYGGLDIFSLNYDCCVEQALTRYCEADKHTLLVDGFSERGWQPDLYSQTHDGQTIIRLFKVHGSLDWINSPEAGLINVSKLPAEFAMEFAGLDPHLIFGTDVKLTGEQPFFSMAHLFYEKLSEANLLVVIGYSFGDGYINSLISQAQRLNVKLRLMHVSPDADKGVGDADEARSIRVDKPIAEKAGELIQDNRLKEEIQSLLESYSESEPF